MKITPNTLRWEFIGLEAKVVDSSHPDYVGISGRVVDETRNTLILFNKDRKKTIVKDTATFNFTMSNGTIIEVKGRAIMGRPEKRIKKQVRRRW
jgi:ribonuclease P protein subunit POP4